MTTSRYQGSLPDYLNEAINFEMRAIFIAVPKTGTTSVRTQLAQPGQALLRGPHLNILQVRGLYPFLLTRGLGSNRNFPTQRVASDAEVRATAREMFESFFKFSAVRNPWDRAVSLYRRREGVSVSAGASCEQFCQHHLYASDTCFYPTLHQNQLDWLCDEEGGCIMDYVYKLEDFNEAVKEIEARTEGRVRREAKRANVNRDGEKKSYREYYTDETRTLIAARFEKDIDYFKFTF